MMIIYTLADILVLMYMGFVCAPRVYTPPKMRYPDKTENIYYVKGSNITIQCIATGSSILWYKWTQNGTEIKNMSSVSFHPKTGVLNIVNFSVNEEAAYRCIVNSTFGGDTQSNYVLIMSPALHLWQIRLEVFGTFGSNITTNVSQYQYLKLQCADSNAMSVAPKITYRWYELSGRTVHLNHGRLYIDLQGNLHFSHVLKVDEVGFYCRMSTGVGLAVQRKYGANHIIQVTDDGNQSSTATKPIHQYDRVEVEFVPACTATLECVFSGYDPSMPTLHQAWLNATKKPLPANRKYILSNDGRQLTIYNLREADSQTYHCWANNSAGQADHQVNVTASISPEFFRETPKDRVVLEGSDVEFKCDARSHFNEQPSLPPAWYINGNTTNGTTKIVFSENDTLLTVKNVEKGTHIMCIQCEVPSQANTLWASACLYVIKSIRILSQPPTLQKIDSKHCINLTVIADAEPGLKLTYKWMFNGRCTNGTYVPPGHVSCRENYNTRCINTTGLSKNQIKGLAGKYIISISNEFETKVVETLVEFSGEQSDPPEEGLKSSFVIFVLSVIPMSVIIFASIIMLCKLRKSSGGGDKKDAVDMFMVKAGLYHLRGSVDNTSTFVDETSMPSNSMTRETNVSPASTVRA